MQNYGLPCGSTISMQIYFIEYLYDKVSAVQMWIVAWQGRFISPAFFNIFLVEKEKRKWSTQATSFRPNPFHANYFLNVYNLSAMHLNKILFKPTLFSKWLFLMLRMSMLKSLALAAELLPVCDYRCHWRSCWGVQDPEAQVESFYKTCTRYKMELRFCWLVVFGIMALWDSISVYIGPSPREWEKENRKDRREKKWPNNPTRTYCKRSRPLPYSDTN